MAQSPFKWMESSSETSFEDQRQAAEQRFQALDKPTLKSPNYKFTSLDRFDWEASAQVGREFHYLPCPYAARAQEECGVLRLRSASFDAESELVDLPEGVLLMSLWEALQERAELLLPYLQRNSELESDIFAQMAWARWQTGYFLYVPKAVQLEKPLRVLQYFDQSSESFFFRNLIVLEEGASLNLVDDFESEPLAASNLAVGSSQVFVGKKARLNYSQIQNWRGEASSFFRQEISLEEDAQLQQTQVQLGAKKAQYRQILHFDQRSRAKSNWSVKTAGVQQLDFWIHQNHKQAESFNELDFLASLNGRSRVVFNGMQNVVKGAKDTNSYQQARALMLSDQASFESLPQLLIAHDEVQIAHGSASSSIDPDQLYYLQSRGIKAEDAERMIVEGFSEPVISCLPTEHLRDQAHQEMKKKAMVS